MTREHRWVKHVVVDVNVTSNPDSDTNEPIMILLDHDIERALAEAVVGCDACSLPLNTETVSTPCRGYDHV